MAAIRGRNTKPEMVVRRGLHRLGFRFQLHRKDLPGKPDLVFPRYRAALFVHGCFWHGHDCHLFTWPKSREEFWRTKIESNRIRDAQDIQRLRKLGWRVGVVWECALKGKRKLDSQRVIQEAGKWLSGDSPEITINCLHSTE